MTRDSEKTPGQVSSRLRKGARRVRERERTLQARVRVPSASLGPTRTRVAGATRTRGRGWLRYGGRAGFGGRGRSGLFGRSAAGDGPGSSGGPGAHGELRELSEGRFLAPSAVCVLITAPALLLDRVPPAVTLSQLVLGCVLTLHTVRQRDRLLAKLDEVREVARITQEAIVRPISRSFAGTHVSTRYHCAVRESGLGGDVYDVAVTPFGLRILVGDVRGHGLEAIRLAAETLAGFRDLAHTVPDLTAVATGLDGRLAPDLGSEDFVTALLAEFAPGEVRLVNCGHPAPLRSGQRVELLEPGVTALPLGLSPDPRQYRVRLQPGDRLLLYTDGLSEARARDGTFFPLLTEAARALRDPLPDEALGTLCSRLLAHTGTSPADDLALVLCQPTEHTAAAPHPARRTA